MHYDSLTTPLQTEGCRDHRFQENMREENFKLRTLSIKLFLSLKWKKKDNYLISRWNISGWLEDCEEQGKSWGEGGSEEALWGCAILEGALDCSLKPLAALDPPASVLPSPCIRRGHKPSIQMEILESHVFPSGKLPYKHKA